MLMHTTQELKTEFLGRAKEHDLFVACGAGGNINAEVAIVAEAPGETEVARGEPLIGGSGSYLWKVLRKSSLTRMDCYITNVCKRQVSFGKDKRRPISKNELSTWEDLLLWELSQLPNLKYVVALGGFALSALTGETGITQWRGSVINASLPGGRLVKVLCTYNPVMVFRSPQVERTFQNDLGKLRRVIDGRHKPTKFITHVNPSYDDAMGWIERMRVEGQDGNPVSFDIENIGMETACVGLCNDPTEGMCINFRTRDQHRYTIEREREIRKGLQKLFMDPEVLLIAQNATYDSYFLWMHDQIRVKPVWFDTMIAHHVLYPLLPHTLAFQVSQYTDNPYYKDELNAWKEGGDIDSFWEYNVKDVCNTYQVATREMRELEAQGLMKFFEEEMKLQPTLIRMTVAGMKLDLSLREKIQEELSLDLDRRLTAFHESVGIATGDTEYRPNPNSNKQMSELYFRRLSLIGRGTSTDDENRKRMLSHPRTNDHAKTVLIRQGEYVGERKFYSTYVTTRLGEDSRFRTEYKQTGVASAPGRLSSGALLGGEGGNVQNQPDRAHPLFIADVGMSLGYFDMAQAEARLVACFANIPKWLAQFERARLDGSYDAHIALAADMFKVNYNDVPTTDRIKHDDGSYSVTMRFIAKRCRHGLNYRMEAPRLADTTGLSLREAYKAYGAYHRETPELRRWWKALEAEARENRCLYNAFGRRMLYIGRITEESLESLVAFKPQSTLGDHVKRVMWQSEQDPRWPFDARMWLNNHDALICMAPHEKVKKCLAIMKEYAEAPITAGKHQIIIPADMKLSQPDDGGIHRWSTLKKVTEL